MLTLKQRLKILSVLMIMLSVPNSLDAQLNWWTITNVAGVGDEGGFEEGDPIETAIPRPISMASDANGDIYFTSVGYFDASIAGVFKLDVSENIISHELIGFSGIAGMAIDKAENMLYFSRGLSLEGGPESIEYIYSKNLSTGMIDTLAGNGYNGFPVDGEHARETYLGGASGLKIDPSGEYLYYLAPTLGGTGAGINFIQRINLATSITERVASVGGTGTESTAESGDDVLTSFVAIGHGLDWDSNGNLYFTTNDNRIYKIVDNKFYRVTGDGAPGYSGDGGLAADAQIFTTTSGVYIDRNTDELYFCDTENKRIRKIILSVSDDPDFLITTFAGTGHDEGDDNPTGDLYNGNFKLLTNANIRPYDILPMDNGFYISDHNYRLRKISRCKEGQVVGSNISKSTICNGEEVTMIIDGELNDANQWTWFEDYCLPTNVIDGENGTSLTVTVDQDKTYYVRGTGGCTSVYIECFQFDLAITCNEYYNTFTPNGDGINEFLEIPAVDNFPINTVRIYNRWGDQLEVIQNYDNESSVWSGNNGTVALDAGTYYFTAEANSVLITSGWVQLVK